MAIRVFGYVFCSGLVSSIFKCVFLSILELKGYQCYSPTNKKYFISADVTFFESIPYFSPQKPITTSGSILLPSFVPLSAPALVPDVSLSVYRQTLESYLHQSLFVISDMFTLTQPKVPPLNQFRPTPLQWKVLFLSHQHLSLIMMFLLPSVKVNGHALIILFFISFSMIVLIFFLPVCSLFVFCLYS